MPLDGELVAARPRRCAVLGSPIDHSLSPALHTAAYRHLGLAWRFSRHEVQTDELAGFVRGLDSSWRGLAITMPLKAAALHLVDVASVVARRAGAVNTIVIEGDRLVGDNTDVAGIRAALAERGCTDVAHAAVLGGGATARSAVVALAGVAGSVTVYVRDATRSASLATSAQEAGLALQVRRWEQRREGLAAPLVIVATPAAAVADLSPVPSGAGTLLEVAYTEAPSSLAAGWRMAGGTVVGGVDLLVHQAVAQIRLMTHGVVPVGILRAALPTGT